MVTSSTSKVEKRAQFENNQSIWPPSEVRSRFSPHGKYLIPAMTIQSRLVDLTDAQTLRPSVKPQPSNVLDLVVGKRKVSWTQVIVDKCTVNAWPSQEVRR